MIAMQLNELELMDAWQEHNDTARVRVQFPFVGISDITSFGAVYFEIEPGNKLATHTDSQDEVVILLSGEGEGRIGDETRQLAAGGVVFIPAMEPHGFRNTGSETIRAFGLFAGPDVVSTFEHDVMPLGIRVFDLQKIPAAV